MRRQLQWLLDTRCPVPDDWVNHADRTVLDYGTPDLSAFNASNAQDRTRLASALASTFAPTTYGRYRQ